MTGADTFDFTAGRIPPFYTEPCDWCQLPYQQLTIPRTWKLHSYFLPRVPNRRPPSLSGACDIQWFPIGLSGMTNPPSVILKIQWSYPKVPRLLPHGNKLRQVLTIKKNRIKGINVYRLPWGVLFTYTVQPPVTSRPLLSATNFRKCQKFPIANESTV